MVRVESEGVFAKVFENDTEIQYVTALKIDYEIGALPKATIELELPIFSGYAMPTYEIQSLASYPAEFLNELAGAIQEELSNRGSI